MLRNPTTISAEKKLCRAIAAFVQNFRGRVRVSLRDVTLEAIATARMCSCKERLWLQMEVEPDVPGGGLGVSVIRELRGQLAPRRGEMAHYYLGGPK